jgi:uncharacterized protein (DUF697 family)
MGYYYYYGIDSNKIQLHYWLEGGAHNMDALTQNKSELEFIRLISEMGKIFDLDFSIETEALVEGGIRRWFKLALKNENKRATITVGLISALVIATVATPITTALSKTTEMLIEKLFEDELDRREKELDIEGKELDNDWKKLNNEKLKQELKNNITKIDSNTKIKKYKSNFYEELEKEKRLEKISFTVEDNERKPLSRELYILKENFKEFILASNEIDTEPIEDAVIEIISPVLKKGDYKWKGIYNGKAISLNMKSNEFKTLIQTGKIEFKNGSAIKCVLDIKKELDNDGNEKIIAYNIMSVNEYFENDRPIETPEGKSSRQKREAIDNQLNIFDDEV